MYCSRCGMKVTYPSLYCSKCGNPLTNSSNSSSFKKNIFIGIGVGLFLVLVIFGISILLGNSSFSYYFSDDDYSNDISATSNVSNKKNAGKTIIVTDNVYNGVSISSSFDANQLISKDSVDQKSNCPREILEVENEIIQKYGITAVNLCEMDVDFARELERVLEHVYKNYPARGYLTNLTLNNFSQLSQSGIIAAFMPVFPFATSDDSSTYPWVIKTQLMLSSSYFLNRKKLEADMKEGSASGHFPPNSTIYSPVAHELGHYLSFLAMMKYHGLDSILLIENQHMDDFSSVYDDFVKGDFSLKMLQEAYQNYQLNYSRTYSFDEWRGTISSYALAKDNSSEYIYDETVAEAFHDVYLNNSNARDASKCIVEVLKKYLGNR